MQRGGAGFGIGGKDCALDGGGAGPARKEGSVHVPATEPRQRKYCLGQDQAIGNDDDQIRRIRGQLSARRRIAQCLGLFDCNARRQRGLLDRACRKLASATRRAIRLGVDGDHLGTAGKAGLQRGNGKFRRTGKDQAHVLAGMADLELGNP